MRADLHVHTTASDGACTPGEVVSAAVQAGFDLLAVTDHDTIGGLKEAFARAQQLGVALLPGVELSVVSAGSDREIHLLGYGLNPDDAGLLHYFSGKERERETRARAMVERVRALGMDVRFEEVRAMAGGVISRSHIAKRMVELGCVGSIKEAFERFLNPGRPAYVPREVTTLAQGCALLRAAGAVPVLAHPGLLRMGEAALEACVCEWQGQGLMGLEVFHPSHQANHARFLYGLARRRGLLVTGGSDYHGEAMRPTHLGDGLTGWESCDADVRALWRAVGTRCGRLFGEPI